MPIKKIIAVIPARGGSKGIPRKNIRHMNGKPLIAWAIGNAKTSRLIDHVVVSTDDEEIEHVAESFGCDVVMRPENLALDSIPLDPVIFHAVKFCEKKFNEKYDVVITLQPTSPLLKSETIDSAIERFFEKNSDTVLSAVDDRHLTWTVRNEKFVPEYEKRLNRQYLPPKFRETGGFVITKRSCVTPDSRFGEIVDLFEVESSESIDIDHYVDWWVCEKLMKRKKILFRVDGYNRIGMGHVYRTLLLATRLIDHELLFVSDKNHSLGVDKIASSFYPYRTFTNEEELFRIVDEFKPDIVINDILDTSSDYMEKLKKDNYFCVNFEDMGNGSKVADIVINALYEESYPVKNHYFGKEWYLLRDEFFMLNPRDVSSEVREILITFGGTDQHNYTEKVINALEILKMENITITIVLGLGYEHIERLKSRIKDSYLDIHLLQDIKNISKFMYQADLIFASAGRTVYEIASLGTPVIIMAQNNRELKHTFARSENGIINLGLGTEVSIQELSDTAMELITNLELRKKCHTLMLQNDLRSGFENVLGLILGEFEKRAIERK
ncbi:MAG: UDP-2,4-diacetamido-2,4,6-trideoxy-beta-L-altropyranose hydrolase [Deltaproteobacteria bacterium]|nr:UDP-2,4-diacetamido-2,4,6-trideoxy-beta-L-altropyranose hydrolase [Deltaproteobacteria bacterium]